MEQSGFAKWLKIITIGISYFVKAMPKPVSRARARLGAQAGREVVCGVGAALGRCVVPTGAGSGKGLP